MAAGSMLRFAGRSRLLQLSGPSLLRPSPKAAGALVLKKDFALTPVSQKRVYAPNEGYHNETSHWMNERYLAFSLYPLVGIGLAYPHPVLDTLLCSAIVLHAHWHASGVSVDYIHGERLPGIVKPAILVASIVAFGGLSYLNYFDIGFANTVRLIFTQL